MNANSETKLGIDSATGTYVPIGAKIIFWRLDLKLQSETLFYFYLQIDQKLQKFA